jgi:serine/threonine protein kinase
VSPNLEPLKETDPRGFGGWKIKGRLGEGGYSTIFLGEKGDQLAAIKMIRSGLLNDENVFNRFATEINNLERINHPGVASYLESDLSTDVPYIAVEYIEGETLEKYVNKYGALKESMWLECLSKVAEALNYCHKLAIIHKDVSPGNIILSQEGPKLIDFGISYHEGDQRVTQLDETVGTPSYMSPEHWDLEPRREMDIFSLGSTFTFAGTGHPAFGGTKQESRAAIWHIRPNFEGLSKTQINLLTPLLYKDFNDRPSLTELVNATNQLRENSELSVFETYLKGSEKKLAKGSDYTVDLKKHSKSRALFSIGLLVALVFSVYAVSDESDQTSTSIDRAITEKAKTDLVNPSVSTSTSATEVNNNVSEKSSNDAANCYKAVEGKTGDVEKLCTIAASKGDIESIWYLGDELQKNTQYSKAAEWFLKGAKRGDYNSMLGLVNAFDKLGKTNERLTWLEECANGFEGISDFSPRSSIGRCKTLYALELRDQGKEKQAILYLKDAMSYGQGDASILLGIIYRNQGMEDLSIKAFEDGVKLGSNEALKQLVAALEDKGDETELFKWLKVAANKGDMYAVKSLSGRYILKKDYVNAKSWGSICAKAGVGECSYFLGLVALFEKDKKTAKEFFITASNQGIDDATLRLGSYYYVEEENYNEAERLLLKLVKKDNFEATVFIVGVYLSKEDVKNACIHAGIASEIAESLIKSKKWETRFDSLLATNKNTYEKLCV